MEWDYKNHKITVTEDGSFLVAGPMNTDERPFSRHIESLLRAKTEIDERLAVAFKRNRTKLALGALNDHGTPCTITGIHLGHGTLLGVEGDYAYPPAAWIAELLQEKRRCHQRAQEIERSVHRFRLKTRYRSNIKPLDYDAEMTLLQQDYDTKKAEAEAANRPEE